MLAGNRSARLVNLVGSCDLTVAGTLQRERRAVGRLGNRTHSGNRLKSGMQSGFEAKCHRKSMAFHAVSDAMRGCQIASVREAREALAEVADE